MAVQPSELVKFLTYRVADVTAGDKEVTGFGKPPGRELSSATLASFKLNVDAVRQSLAAAKQFARDGTVPTSFYGIK